MGYPIGADQYYRRSALLPFIIFACTAVVWGVTLMRGSAGMESSPFVRAAQILAVVHVYALIPYSVLLCIAILWIRRAKSAPSVRQVMWSTPLVLALGVTAFIFLTEALKEQSVAPPIKSIAWGLGTAIVGYAYVVVIEVGMLIARRLGLIRG